MEGVKDMLPPFWAYGGHGPVGRPVYTSAVAYLDDDPCKTKNLPIYFINLYIYYTVRDFCVIFIYLYTYYILYIWVLISMLYW